MNNEWLHTINVMTFVLGDGWLNKLLMHEHREQCVTKSFKFKN